MPRTAARVTQADIARTVRAVAQARVKAVVEVAPDGTIRVVFGGGEQRLEEPRKLTVEEKEEIVL
jgi:acylphosphatase